MVDEALNAVRALAREDLDAVVAIDAAIEGRPRRTYFERRLAAAVRSPKLHAQFAATDTAGLAGYILARVLEGEFGRTEPGLRLEIVGVRRDREAAEPCDDGDDGENRLHVSDSRARCRGAT